MADININIVIPDAYVERLSNIIDLVWAGRENQNPIPSNIQWLKYHIIKNLKQQILKAEKEAAEITEIEII